MKTPAKYKQTNKQMSSYLCFIEFINSIYLFVCLYLAGVFDIAHNCVKLFWPKHFNYYCELFPGSYLNSTTLDAKYIIFCQTPVGSWLIFSMLLLGAKLIFVTLPPGAGLFFEPEKRRDHSQALMPVTK